MLQNNNYYLHQFLVLYQCPNEVKKLMKSLIRQLVWSDMKTNVTHSKFLIQFQCDILLDSLWKTTPLTEQVSNITTFNELNINRNKYHCMTKKVRCETIHNLTYLESWWVTLNTMKSMNFLDARILCNITKGMKEER